MMRYPHARAQEFRALVSRSQLAGRERICDLLAGGGYLSAYLPASVLLTSVEAATAFQQNFSGPGGCTLCLPEQLPFPDGSFDRVLSLAALHHVERHSDVFSEVYRVLVPGGLFCIGDVLAGSAEAKFLDEVVGQNAPGGHRGAFINDEFIEDLKRMGFLILSDEWQPCHWVLYSRAELMQFVQMLFGLESMPGGQLEYELSTRIGIVERDLVSLLWALRFVVARRV